MENNTPTPRPANMQQDDSGLNIREIIAIVVNNWYWFALSTVLCLIGAAFLYKTTPKTFQTTGTVMLRDDSNKGGRAGQNMDVIFQQMGMSTSNVSIDNEIYVIKSSPIMVSVVQRLGLTTYCNRNTLFHKTAYYRDAPLDIKVFDRTDNPGALAMSVDVEPVDKLKFRYTITSFDGKPVKSSLKEAYFNQIIRINDEVSFSVDKTDFYTEECDGTHFSLGIRPALDVARGIMSRLTVAKADKMAAILNITVTDANAMRAADIIDTLVVAYNEDVLNDKNKVTLKTESFINDRIAIISGELTSVDAQVAQLQQNTRLPDLQSAGSTLLSSSTRYTEEVVALETQLTLIKYVKDYIADPANANDLIPANVGISNAGIQSMINTTTTRY